MKLVYKFASWYLAITTLVLLGGGVIVFSSVQHENDEEEVRRLQGLMEDAVHQLKKNVPVESLQSERVQIKEISESYPLVERVVKDTMSWHSQFQGTERQIKATASYKIGGKHYLISARAFAPEPEETVTGVILSLSWIFLLLLLVVALTSIVVSGKILSPFNKSLSAMQEFDLRQKASINLPQTKTREFKELNIFLEKMTTKALEDYRALKEFTENASHELQTPVSIIRGKLELLLESDITDEQARLIMSAHEAVEKLSRTNQSLTLLTKLENHEYAPASPVDLSEKLHKIIFSLAELMEMKSISLQKDVRENVVVQLHPALTDILLMNLLSNAIRHNEINGTIKIKLDTEVLVISNTGKQPDVLAAW